MLSTIGTDFHWVISDDNADPAKVKKLLFCSGKIYYELAKVKHHLLVLVNGVHQLEKS